MVRPGTFHAPGLDAKTDTTIRNILRRWAKSEAPAKEAKSSKKRK